MLRPFSCASLSHTNAHSNGLLMSHGALLLTSLDKGLLLLVSVAVTPEQPLSAASLVWACRLGQDSSGSCGQPALRLPPSGDQRQR